MPTLQCSLFLAAYGDNSLTVTSYERILVTATKWTQTNGIYMEADGVIHCGTICSKKTCIEFRYENVLFLDSSIYHTTVHTSVQTKYR
jgi:hypothetical protein